jgi:hypothetical protein
MTGNSNLFFLIKDYRRTPRWLNSASIGSGKLESRPPFARQVTSEDIQARSVGALICVLESGRNAEKQYFSTPFRKRVGAGFSCRAVRVV